MPRSYNERQHLTERYQNKQIKRAGPFKDYKRRPKDTFLWELMGLEIYPRYDWNAPANQLDGARRGYYRNHSPYSCSCHRCLGGWNKYDENEMRAKRKTYKQDQDYHDGLKEYHISISDDKYKYDKEIGRNIRHNACRRGRINPHRSLGRI